jgi:hypothetical protein
MAKRNTERDAQIVGMLQGGATLAAVGRPFGISRQRVRQIAHANGIKGRRDRLRMATPNHTTLCDWWRSGICTCKDSGPYSAEAHIRELTQLVRHYRKAMQEAARMKSATALELRTYLVTALKADVPSHHPWCSDADRFSVEACDQCRELFERYPVRNP